MPKIESSTIREVGQRAFGFAGTLCEGSPSVGAGDVGRFSDIVQLDFAMGVLIRQS
ncbi:MAG TPA: hypothetical protein VGY55_20005 [Pirellulales bacterium]|nr:hypothetical protein [Pirellulales bacterium]